MYVIFLGQTIGSIIGCFLSPLIYQRFPCEPQLAIAVAIAAITVATSTFSTNIYSFVLLRSVTYLAQSYLDTGKIQTVLHSYRPEPLIMINKL